jgi:hypothetical protein
VEAGVECSFSTLTLIPSKDFYIQSVLLCHISSSCHHGPGYWTGSTTKDSWKPFYAICHGLGF